MIFNGRSLVSVFVRLSLLFLVFLFLLLTLVLLLFLILFIFLLALEPLVFEKLCSGEPFHRVIIEELCKQAL